ncbi:MAG: two-component system sensor histidine kinase CreC [Verrucomicrobiota bacterium]
MKIRTAIFGVYVLASAVGFAVMMALVLRDVRFRYVESMRRTLGDTAVFLAASVTLSADAGDGWWRKLEPLSANMDMLRIFACDREGRVVFDSQDGADVGRIYSFPMTGGGDRASENYTLSNVAEVSGELRVAAPVRRGSEVVGRVGVGRRLATVTDSVRRARKDLIWSLGWIALIMVGVGWYIATKLTHSLERLTAYAQAVRSGEVAIPPASRAKEIHALSQAFEEMRIALEGKAYVERYTEALTHEFKAPLSAIRGAAELLAENPPEADRARFIANLRAETARLQRIVERLLELASLESRRAGETLVEVDFPAVVAKACDEAKGAAALKRVEVAVALPAAARVRGDAFLLEQAVGNLVQNAVDFSPAGSTVTVSLTVDAQHASVNVEDCGPGVPDYAHERIFERFYSLPRPDTGRKSSGLGLSIVREIARLHRGEATLENRSEGGARARLVLPVA